MMVKAERQTASSYTQKLIWHVQKAIIIDVVR